MSRKMENRLFKERPGLRESFEANRAKRNLSLAMRALRKEAGLTQLDIQKKSGLSQSHVSKIESATGPMPSPESIRKYADACEAKARVEFLPKTASDTADDSKVIAAAML